MGQGEEGQDESSASGEGGSQGSTSSRKLIDLRDCLTDSPRFRIQLSEHETEVTDLESKLDKVVTSCDRMVNNGQAYVEACRSFSSSVRELAGHFHDNSVVEQSLRRFYDTLAEVQSYHSILFDQAQRSVQSALRSFLTGELKKVKDMKKTFHRVSEDFNVAVHRNAHAPKSKPLEADELSSQLANMQTQFSHTAIDYGYHINTVSCIKGHRLLDHLLSYMRAQFTFFHQGYDLLREFDPYMRHVLSQVDNLQKAAEEGISAMNSRHNLVIPQHLKDGSPAEPLRPMDNPAVAIELEGYLFKRSSGAFKSWNRRWFVLRNSQLCYQSESKAEELVVVVEDLRICTFKMADDLDRRFCFEVVTPVRSSMLQADSEASRKTWMAYLEGGIARALRITASNKKKDDVQELRVRTATLTRGRSPTPELSESPILGKKTGSLTSLYSLGLDFLEVPGNDRCADCNSVNPKWASINLGIMLCIECCGIHRNLGVHISKVRSITLDEWEPEIQMIMCGLGNARVNAILEYEIPDHVKKPTTSTSRADREAYIRAKYVLNAFVHPHPDFKRPEVPVAPPQPSLQQLLSSNRERQSDGSPRSTPHASPQVSKRMLSPSIRMRATKPKYYRPLSQSVSVGPSDMDATSLSMDSDDDLLREVSSNSGASSSMALLAENYKKLEKSGKLKNWNIAKIKAPKKSSFTQLSGKFSKSYQALNRRFRSDSTKSAKLFVDRDAHSDNEDSEGSSSTPLLHSKSVNSLSPPPKPPRTFTQRRLDLTGDGDAANVLFNDGDDFSSDVLSAIKEMGVVAVSNAKGRRKSEESMEERLSKSLPNGGLQILSSSSSGRISPGPPHSPRAISPLASEPPTRAFPPPPALSPVHEGESQAAEKAQCDGKEDPANSVLSPASVDSYQTSVFSEVNNKSALESVDSVANGDGEIASADTVSTSTLVSTTFEANATSTNPPILDGALVDSTGCVFLTQSDKPDDAFSEFQSAPPVGLQQNSSTTSSAQELKVPNTDTLNYEVRLAFDNKRFSMISVASTDWFSADEDDGEEDNESNSSDNFPELQCPNPDSYLAVCPNPLEEEHHQFSTPPTSPPLPILLGKEKTLLDGAAYRNNSTRPRSASSLGFLRRSEERQLGEESQGSNTRPKSASPLVQPLIDDLYGNGVADDRKGTLCPHRNHVDGPKSEPNVNGTLGSREGTGEPLSRESSQPPPANSVKDSQKTVKSDEAETHEEPNESFEDATENESSFLSLSATSVDTGTAIETQSTPQKSSFSADTSPSTVERSKTVSGSSLTRSATDITLQTKAKSPYMLRSRQRSSTIGITSKLDTGSRRNLEEAPNRSKDEDYFAKLIQRTGEEKLSNNPVAQFSDQDFADILRSSLRGSKVVPMVKVESVDDNDEVVVTKNGVEVDGEGEGGNEEGKGEGGKDRPVKIHNQNHLQAPCVQSVSPDSIEAVIIPDNISPDLYLYQSVCTVDMAAILCAKAHGGDINFINLDDEGKSPMLIAIEKCSTDLIEFLYQNGAKLTLCDEKGRSCLHYAALTDDASVVVLLLKRGAKTDAVDSEGKDPVKIAIDQENGDIVTLLRMAKLKQEERGNVEDQVAAVYKDFEMAVQMDPERMKRRSQASSDTSSITSRELK